MNETKLSLWRPSVEMTKAEIRELASVVETRVKDGEYDPVQALIRAKKGAELFKEIEKRVRPVAEESLSVPKGQKYEHYNTEITESETGVRYDFAACEDQIWDFLNSELETLKERIKDREAFLKTVKKETGEFDLESGESWVIKPPIRSGKLGLKIQIK